jgi:opacity protein-like surface antigen
MMAWEDVVRITRILFFGAAAFMFATRAFADGRITPYIGYNYGGDSSNCVSLRDCEERHANFGISFGSANPVGFEADFAYARNFFGATPDGNNSVLTLMTNLVFGIPIGPVQPYVVGGVGLIRPHASLNPTQLVASKNAFGYDLGFGVTVFFTRGLGVRGDIRRFRTFEDLTLFVFSGGKLEFSRASAGLTFRY